MLQENSFISSLKCLIDLHLHIDGSVSVRSARELAKIENVILPESDEELKNMLTVSDDCKDLNEYLEKFSLPGMLMQSEESIEKCVYNLCCELREKGYIYAELRFAPQKHCEKGMSQEQAVISAIRGIRLSGFEAQLILCCMRDGADNSAENISTVFLTEKYLGKGVCACDLAGAEALFPNERYKYIFEKARELSVPFTIHSGEALGADSVKKAVEYGAARIGHGVRSIEDPETVKLLSEKNIPLEICPTSNINTCVFKNISEIPVSKLIKQGVTVTINSDNMSVSATDVRKELLKISEAFSFGMDDIKMLLVNSANSSFADDALKKRLVEKINSEF